jgi:hypothetical protein
LMSLAALGRDAGAKLGDVGRAGLPHGLHGGETLGRRRARICRSVARGAGCGCLRGHLGRNRAQKCEAKNSRQNRRIPERTKRHVCHLWVRSPRPQCQPKPAARQPQMRPVTERARGTPSATSKARPQSHLSNFRVHPSS